MMLLRRQEFEPTSSFLDFLHLGTCTDCPRNQRTSNDSLLGSASFVNAIICVNYIFGSKWATVSLQLAVCNCY